MGWEVRSCTTYYVGWRGPLQTGKEMACDREKLSQDGTIKKDAEQPSKHLYKHL